MEEEFAFEVIEEVKKEATPLDRVKYAMSCKPMRSNLAEQTYLKIAETCKSFDEMPLLMQAYVNEAEQEMSYQSPETVV